MTLRAENWIGEFTSTVGTGDIIFGGQIIGFAPFKAVGDNVEVFYTVMDGTNKETGIGLIQGGVLKRNNVQATLIDGTYVKGNTPLNLSGDAQVYLTANASLLDSIQSIDSTSQQNSKDIVKLFNVTINNQPLSSGNISLDADDVGARPASWTPSASDVNAYSKDESDARFLQGTQTESSAGKLVREDGPTINGLKQDIADVSTAFIGSAPPAGAPVGKRWFDTQSGRTFIKYNDGDSTQWVEESPNPSTPDYYSFSAGESRFFETRAQLAKKADQYHPMDGQLVPRATDLRLLAAIQNGELPVCTDAEWLADPYKRSNYTLGDGVTNIRLPDRNGKSSGSLGRVFAGGDGANAPAAGVIHGDATRNIEFAIGFAPYDDGGATPIVQTRSNNISIAKGVAGTSMTALMFAHSGNSSVVSFDLSKTNPTAQQTRPVSCSQVWATRR